MNTKTEVTLQQLVDKVCEALGNGGWSLRRTNSSDGSRLWRAFTTYGVDEVYGHGSTPGEALTSFLAAVLDHEQAQSREHEDVARDARDRVARVQRAIESL